MGVGEKGGKLKSGFQHKEGDFLLGSERERGKQTTHTSSRSRRELCRLRNEIQSYSSQYLFKPPDLESTESHESSRKVIICFWNEEEVFSSSTLTFKKKKKDTHNPRASQLDPHRHPSGFCFNSLARFLKKCAKKRATLQLLSCSKQNLGGCKKEERGNKDSLDGFRRRARASLLHLLLPTVAKRRLLKSGMKREREREKRATSSRISNVFFACAILLLLFSRSSGVVKKSVGVKSIPENNVCACARACACVCKLPGRKQTRPH